MAPCPKFRYKLKVKSNATPELGRVELGPARGLPSTVVPRLEAAACSIFLQGCARIQPRMYIADAAAGIICRPSPRQSAGTLARPIYPGEQGAKIVCTTLTVPSALPTTRASYEGKATRTSYEAKGNIRGSLELKPRLPRRGSTGSFQTLELSAFSADPTASHSPAGVLLSSYVEDEVTPLCGAPASPAPVTPEPLTAQLAGQVSTQLEPHLAGPQTTPNSITTTSGSSDRTRPTAVDAWLEMTRDQVGSRTDNSIPSPTLSTVSEHSSASETSPDSRSCRKHRRHAKTTWSALNPAQLAPMGSDSDPSSTSTAQRPSAYSPVPIKPLCSLDQDPAPLRPPAAPEQEAQEYEYEYESEMPELERKLGKGSFGEVHVGRWQMVHVAVKVLSTQGQVARKEAGATPAALVASFQRELGFHRRLNHPNVVRLLAAVRTAQEQVGLVLELCERGSLYDLLKKAGRAAAAGPGALDWAHRLHLALGAARGMGYVHAQRVIHADLKSPNLLVDRAWTCKVADFGLSERQGTQVPRQRINSPQWLAPELLRGEAYDTAVDVFAFGVVLWELAHLREPWGELLDGAGTELALVGPVAYEGRRLEFAAGAGPVPPALPAGWASLAQACWAEQPAARPTFREVAQQLEAMSRALKGRVG